MMRESPEAQMWIWQDIKGKWLGEEEKDPTFSHHLFSGPGAT